MNVYLNRNNLYEYKYGVNAQLLTHTNLKKKLGSVHRLTLQYLHNENLQHFNILLWNETEINDRVINENTNHIFLFIE